MFHQAMVIMMTKPIPILYSGGSYGTFIEWSLNHFSSVNGLPYPFMNSGSSHKYHGNILSNINGWRAYTPSPTDNTHIVRLHPKINKDDSVLKTIDEILLSTDKIIITYFDNNSFLLTINNKFDKVWANWLEHNEAIISENLKSWEGKALATMAVWEIREFLSFFIEKQHLAESENETIQSLSDPRFFKLNISDLFTDYENLIRSMLDFCELDLYRQDFLEVHSQWVKLQKHRHKDILVRNIVDSVIDGSYLEWTDLSIVDESFVQSRLRDLHSLDLKCYNLNVFPKNTTDLKKLLINV
jgi:hypothetical protein